MTTEEAGRQLEIPARGAEGQEHDRKRPGTRDERKREREHGDVRALLRSQAVPSDVLSRAGFPREHHLERDQEQHDAAGDAECLDADAHDARNQVPPTANRGTSCPTAGRPSAPCGAGNAWSAPSVSAAKSGTSEIGSTMTKNNTKNFRSSSVIPAPFAAG